MAISKEVVQELLKEYKNQEDLLGSEGILNQLQKELLEAALRKLDEFAGLWDEKYPLISKSWRTRWTELVPFLAYPKEIRRVMYTTHAIGR